MSKKHYCEECGKPLTDFEYIKYDGICTKCYSFWKKYN